MEAKTVLLTGASSGFGKMLADDLIRKNYNLILGIRGGQARFSSLFGSLSPDPKKVFAVDLHLDKPDTFKSALGLIDEKFQGKLDVLVNNAGYGMLGPLEGQSDQELRNQMEVCFFGPAGLIQNTLPALHKAKGRIINVSSVAGIISFPFYGAYNASKFALEGYSEALYYELKPFGIQVCLVQPGGYKTGFDKGVLFTESAKQPESRYFTKLKNYEELIWKKGFKFAGNPARVVNLMGSLIEKKSMPLRVRTGSDAFFLGLICALIPSNLRVKIFEILFRRFVLKS